LIAGPPKNWDAKHVHSIYPNIMEWPHSESVRGSRTLSKWELVMNFRIRS
jgi:hypothetical protein